MNNSDDRKPAPSRNQHAVLTAMFGGDAPTAAPMLREIERMNTEHLNALYAAAEAVATGTTGHITDADAARDTLDDQADAAVAGVLARVQQELRELEAKYTDLLEKNAGLRETVIATQRDLTRVSSEAAALHEQRDSLWRQNVALIRGGQPVHEFDMSFHAEDAAYAVQRAQMLEAEGAHTAPRWARDSHGRITGLDVLHLAAVADIEPAVMATAGDEGETMDEQRKAA